MTKLLTAVPDPEEPADPIDVAIEATTPPPTREIPTTKFSLQLVTGKPAVIEMPNDANDSDWLNLIGVIMTQVRPALMQIRAANDPTHRLVSPIGTPLKPLD